MSPSPAGGSLGSLSRAALDEEREFLLRSLRDLEAERDAGDIDEVDYRSLRDDYTARAADVLRHLASLDRPPPPPDDPTGAAGSPPADAAGSPPGAVSGSGAVSGPGAVSGSAPDAVSESGPGALRGSGPGGADAGGPAPAAVGAVADGVPSPPSRRGRRRAVVGAVVLAVIAGVTLAVSALQNRAGPSETQRVDTLDVAAQTAISGTRPDPVAALRDYAAALQINPDNPVALTGEGEILTNVGSARGGTTQEMSLGLERLAAAESVDPSYGPAYGYRGIALYNDGDDRDAVSQLDTYLADTPKKAQSPQAVLARQRARARLAATGR